MSLIPDNFVLQYSSNAGDIAHQGVLGSNISKTTILTSTFPTTSTSDSLGHYHYTEPTTNALQFLNASGSGIGGHQFWNSNDTLAPLKYFDVNRDRALLESSLRNTTNKTILDMANNRLTLTDALGTTQTNINADSYQINNQPEGVALGFGNNRVYVSTTTTDVGTIIYAGQVQNTDFPNKNQSVLTTTHLDINKVFTIQKSVLTSENLSITDLNSNVSILTPTNLTFNGVSYAQNQVAPTLIYSSPLIYANGIEPANGLAIRNTYGYSGWYFKNITASNKINWYFPAQTRTSTTVANLKGIAISFFNGQTVSNDDTLFITVYTNLTGTNDYAPGFFHSSMTYVFNQAITPIANTNYQGVCIVDKNLVPFNFETQIQFEPSTVNNPRGDYSQNDTILAVVIGTNSASAQNSVELVVNKLNLIYSNFTQSYLLVPP